jgi:hypothetical protein
MVSLTASTLAAPVAPDRLRRGAADRGLAVGVLYENGTWLAPLLDGLGERGLPHHAIDLSAGAVDLDAPSDQPLYINRVSPSAGLRGHDAAIPLATAWLAALERAGTRVINGARSFQLETSKAAQHHLFRALGVHTPATAIFNDPRAIRRTARTFPFPAILKPETGGSGAHVRFVGSRAHLDQILDNERELFAPGRVFLLQEFVAATDGSIVRTEFVDGEFMFAMRQRPTNTFNLCPADGCERPASDVDDATPDVEFSLADDLSRDAIAEAGAIVRAAGIEIGGVEYIQTPDGRRHFFDINATSVYRADIVAASGIDAMSRLSAFVEREYVAAIAARSGGPSRRPRTAGI